MRKKLEDIRTQSKNNLTRKQLRQMQYRCRQVIRKASGLTTPIDTAIRAQVDCQAGDHTKCSSVVCKAREKEVGLFSNVQ